MKLIDILVEELPKRGWWPEGAKTVAQDSCGEVWGFNCGAPKINNGLWWSSASGTDLISSSKVQLDLLADDWSSTFITREQYEAELAAKNDGWIEWSGGECPVDPDTIVDYVMQDGSESERPEEASALRWDFCVKTEPYAIIAYRLHQPQKTERPEASEEDLNECIGQAPAPLWNGEGLVPPVGCECEFMKHTLDAIPNWRRGIIKYVSEYTVVIVEALSPGEFVAHPRTCDFRPIISEAERKRDAAIAAIFEIIDEGPSTPQNAIDVYDAIAAGEIPGVKLDD